MCESTGGTDLKYDYYILGHFIHGDQDRWHSSYRAHGILCNILYSVAPISFLVLKCVQLIGIYNRPKDIGYSEAIHHSPIISILGNERCRVWHQL
jgi:hypothetical protein